MISASDAVEKVGYDLLTGVRGGSGPFPGASVFQHVPQDTMPPVVIIGDVDEEPLDTKDEEDEDARVTLTIVSIVDGEARKPILAIQSQIKARLNGAREDIDGWHLAFRWKSSTANLSPEGDGYDGNSEFEIYALRD